MSGLLWTAFFDDDVQAFERCLATAMYNTRGTGAIVGSPDYATSPSTMSKGRKITTPKAPAYHTLTKADINYRDALGLTLLHHVASSVEPNAIDFATALIDHPLIDLYIQDRENGWTALHRAFYFGNIAIARLILERDTGSAFGRAGMVNQLAKVKDKEGLGPFDLYGATIIEDSTLHAERGHRQRSGSLSSDEGQIVGDDDGEGSENNYRVPFLEVDGTDLFSFGSGSNMNLGLGDQDDRQFPERVSLRRPDHLVKRFYQEHTQRLEGKWLPHDPAYTSKASDIPGMWIEDIPWMVRSRPLVVANVVMSKLHTAVITADSECNLYMCGHGQGGRLGTGDERTRFNCVPIEGGGLAGKHVSTVALGQNHTLALSDDGNIFSWGNNGLGQLGYSLPKSNKDEDPISVIPRQIFGQLKRESVIGLAASRIHSVAHTSTSLFTFGKNEGQLGIVDSDARSLEIQVTPRKVAASLFTAPISFVAAIDRATICLLENNDLWIFANYGYAKIVLPLDGFSNHFSKLATSYDAVASNVVKISAAGDSICALTSRGEVFTVSIDQRLDNQTSVSTTNPSKIRSAISPPQRVWSPKKMSMAARDVGLDVDGSIILSTEEGSVWKRTKRLKLKDASAAGISEYKPKDYKFSRIPGLTRVVAVRASGYGAYAAVRKDCDVMRSHTTVEEPTIWKDLFPLLSLHKMLENNANDENDEDRPRLWQGNKKVAGLASLKKAILSSADIDSDLAALFVNVTSKCDAFLATSSSQVKIPVHRFLLTGRSRVLRRGFRDLCETSTFTIGDIGRAELEQDGRVTLTFQGVDILTVLDLALYLYTDSVIEFWNFVRGAPKMAYTYRQVRVELMKIATKLELCLLEPAVRQMVSPGPSLDTDLEVAIQDPAFFFDGDVVIQLENDEMRVHSAVICARCPFFEGLFMGRAGGRWLAGRTNTQSIDVDLKHINAKTFKLVLRHIYCDTGAELFDDIVSTDVDCFLDAVTDVLSCANELMLDRLSQIAQAVAGQFVNTRNVCGLLNAISPSSVHEFKHAGLEYLCLNLEAMLQGHLLNELDPDLLQELDMAVRDNQLACMPFAKSGRAERQLHASHPDLAAAIELNKRRKLDAVTLRSKYQTNFAVGSFADDSMPSPMQHKSRRRSSNINKMDDDQDRPPLKLKASSKDMMFDMDEELESHMRSPRESPVIGPMASPRGLDSIAQAAERHGQSWHISRGKGAVQSTTPGSITPRTPRSPYLTGKTPPGLSKPWSTAPLSAKTDMKNIMAQAAVSRTSTLSQGLAASKGSALDAPSPFSLPGPKMSQRERKRMQSAQQQISISHATAPGKDAGTLPQTFSWRAAAPKRSEVQEVVASEAAATPGNGTSPRPASTPQLTMRQTVANPKPSKANATSATVGQRSVSGISNSQPIPRSIRHQPIEEPLWGSSMSEIVAQQQAEKDIIREAVAKRDLQDIQVEQEFQEWWDKEAARVQEAERRASAAASKPARRKVRGGHRGMGRKESAGEGNAQGGAKAAHS